MSGKKKIAIVITSLNGGGAEKVCLTLAAGFEKHGIEAHLIALNPDQDYSLPDNIHTHFAFTKKQKLHRKSTQTRAANFLRSLDKKIGHFDAVLSNLDDTHPIVAKCDFPNTRYVVHNSVLGILARTKKLGPFKYWRKRRAFSILNGQPTIAVSEALARELNSLKLFSASNIATLYNPVQLTKIRRLANSSEARLARKPYIVFVGRGARQKRLDILFEAYAQLDHGHDLIILGADLKKYQKQIQALPAEKKVVAVPFQQNPYPWIAGAECLVVSSDFEGFGLVIVEALACRTRVVSTDCPHGPAEILRGDLARYLVPPGNSQALAQKIDSALEDTRYPFQDAMLERFDHERVTRRYLELLGFLNTPTRR